MMDTDRAAWMDGWMDADRRGPTIATVATEFHCAVGSYFVFRIPQKAKFKFRIRQRTQSAPIDCDG
jgi:hypothetical protein